MTDARVLLAVNDFPPLMGGESALYHALARHLPAGDTLVLAPRLPGSETIDRTLGAEVVRRWVPAHRGLASRALRSLLAGVHLLRLLLARRVRYILCGQLLSLGVPTLLLARLLRLRYAVFVHGADLLDYRDRYPWGCLARAVLTGADAVIANSRFTSELVRQSLPRPPRRLVVLPMGVDPAPRVDPLSVARLRERYRLGDGPVLLSVSRLIPMKGHDVVVRSLPDLLVRRPGLRYLIVGDGPHRPALERLADDRGVAGSVTFAGRVDRDLLPAHYALATLFVQLSRATGGYDGLEGFGLACLEAASFGLPCLAGRSGGVPEAVAEGRSGLLLPPEDEAAFARAVERLLSDAGEWRRLAEGARAWAAEHRWERSAATVLDLVGGP